MSRRLVFLGILGVCWTTELGAQQLAAFARLDASSFLNGPTSGQFIEPANNVAVPFESRQPIQGISSIIKTDAGRLLAISDNGFGTRENSPDYLLLVHELLPDFRTPEGGSGELKTKLLFSLRDPDEKIGFPIVASMETYPGTPEIEVDYRIKEQRLLTGADFDIESFRQLPDGTFWFGDEFGPFLIHTDKTGRVLEPPVKLDGIMSPQNPFLERMEPTVPRSGGFEAMALSTDGRLLYPMLEKPLIAGPERELSIFRFHLPTGKYVSQRPFLRYHLEPLGTSVAELTAINDHIFLAIERDGGEFESARLKTIFLVDFDAVDNQGFVRKRKLLDLLAIDDPNQLASADARFSFPFETTESVAMFDEQTLALVNDNNYPFSPSRDGKGTPQDTELILIRFEESIAQMSVEPVARSR